MKLLLVSGPPSTGKTMVIRRVIERLQNKYKIAYLKMDVIKAYEDEILAQEYGINTKKVYVGDLCPDHAEVMILEEAIEWAEGLKSDLFIIESAGLCLRCSPFLSQGVGVATQSMISGLHAVDKMQQLICFADVAVLTMNDLVSQAEREIFVQNLQQKHKNLKIIETNALQGTAMEYLCKIIAESQDINPKELMLKGNPPLGTCTICIGSKKIGWRNHFGVVRTLETNVADYMYRGD